MNALHHAMCAGNLKVPISFNGITSNICTHPFPTSDDFPNHVTRLESKDFALPFRAAPWKSPSVNITKLAALSAFGCDKQGDNMLPLDLLWCRWPYGYCIEPMTLGNTALFPIPFGVPMHSSRRATRYLHLGTAQHRGLPEQAPTHSGVGLLTSPIFEALPDDMPEFFSADCSR